jgi:hypothetical protein
MTYGWSGSAWRPSRDSGAIISDKTYPAIPQAALADRVAVLIGTSKRAPSKMSSGKDGNWVRITSKPLTLLISPGKDRAANGQNKREPLL